MCAGKMPNHEKATPDWKTDNEVKGSAIGIG